MACFLTSDGRVLRNVASSQAPEGSHLISPARADELTRCEYCGLDLSETTTRFTGGLGLVYCSPGCRRRDHESAEAIEMAHGFSSYGMDRMEGGRR